jgi:hypothetical protein
VHFFSSLYFPGRIRSAKCNPFDSSWNAGFRGAGVSPAFLRYVEIGKIAGETPAPQRTIVA